MVSGEVRGAVAANEFRMMKTFWRWMVVMRQVNRTPKSGQNGKFYVMCILLNKNKTQNKKNP